MTNRYLVATLFGLLIGFFVVTTIAIFPSDPLDRSGWSNLLWNENVMTCSLGKSGSALPLFCEALFLQVCMFALEKGIFLVAAPPVIACGLLKLIDEEERSPVIRYAYAGIIVVLIAIAGAFTIGVFAACSESAHTPLAQTIFFAWGMGYIFAFAFIQLHGIPIAFVLGVVGTLLGHWIYSFEATRHAQQFQ